MQFFFTDYDAAQLTLVQFHVMQAVHELYGKDPFSIAPDRISMFNKICGTDYVFKTFSSSFKVSDIAGYWSSDVEGFRELSEKYKLYK